MISIDFVIPNRPLWTPAYRGEYTTSMADLLDDNDMGGDIVAEPMRRALGDRYLQYALSTITNRALPDARDGLKPVHRRILYAMKESGYDWNRAYRKSARIVGDVMGQYHPHGDASIGDAIIHIGQKDLLIDTQGNWGEIYVSEFYTECSSIMYVASI